jgi:hypothetical protein
MANKSIIVCLDENTADLASDALRLRGYQVKLDGPLEFAIWDRSRIGGRAEIVQDCWLVTGDK